jgi:predicted nucleic acid-binding protein
VIVLDTNVLSELMRVDCDPAVFAWMNRQPAASTWTTAVSVFEIRLGLESLTPGRRRDKLAKEFSGVVDRDLGGRVLPFDIAAAEAAARIAAGQRRVGRPVEIRDVQIAGIIAGRKATLATRNTKHFEGIGLMLVNPWTA